MAAPTVNESRTRSLLPRIARVGAEPSGRDAVALGLVDALLECDDETCASALDALRDARARADGDEELIGWLDAAISFAHWGVERTASQAVVAGGTQAHDFLQALDGGPQLGSRELRSRLEIDETQVSRTGRRLLESGLVSRRKVGREVFWQLTPRGRNALEEAPAPRRASGSEFWQEALRRGFTAADGDEHGEVDPARERIIESTLELHTSRGIQATTWPEIAERAGVPEATVKEHFPTVDDLFRSCGQHIMESLRFPPTDQAAEVFTGASSQDERIHRMVEAFFGAYERGGDAIRAGRRERKEVPVVDESIAELESSFDAVILEALRPDRPDAGSVAALRALTDVEVWDILRQHGATPEAAVDEASTAVEHWLEAQPAA